MTSMKQTGSSQAAYEASISVLNAKADSDRKHHREKYIAKQNELRAAKALSGKGSAVTGGSVKFPEMATADELCTLIRSDPPRPFTYDEVMGLWENGEAPKIYPELLRLFAWGILPSVSNGAARWLFLQRYL